MYENASQLSKVYLKCNWAIDGLITKSEKAVMECSRPRPTFITKCVSLTSAKVISNTDSSILITFDMSNDDNCLF